MRILLRALVESAREVTSWPPIHTYRDFYETSNDGLGGADDADGTKRRANARLGSQPWQTDEHVVQHTSTTFCGRIGSHKTRQRYIWTAEPTAHRGGLAEGGGTWARSPCRRSQMGQLGRPNRGVQPPCMHPNARLALMGLARWSIREPHLRADRPTSTPHARVRRADQARLLHQDLIVVHSDLPSTQLAPLSCPTLRASSPPRPLRSQPSFLPTYYIDRSWSRWSFFIIIIIMILVHTALKEQARAALSPISTHGSARVES